MSAFIRRGNPYECSSLQQYGLKCSSVIPCKSCSASDSNSATQPGQSRPDYHRNFLSDLLEVMRYLDEAWAEKLLRMVRGNATFEQIHCHLDSSLSSMLAQCTDEDSRRKLQSTRQRMEVYSRVPSFRPKITDVRQLGENAPYNVPAKPWTTVTDDDALVSYLVSVYFTWDYPFYAFVDRSVLCKHITMGDIHSDLCSPFLVNALLANACYYSQYSEAYELPGDIRTMGTYFLAEAEQHLRTHQFETGSGIRLASIQATLLLYERYSMAGQNNHGYHMLHRAIEMAEELGIINGPRLNLDQSHMSEDMISSIKRTAWGLFQVDTVVHANFLRPSRISEVSVEQIDRNENDETDLWTPYPLDRGASPSWMSQYFDEACKLSRIARDISRVLRPDQDPGGNMNEPKGVLYENLRRWEEELPEEFAPDKRPASHIILLRLRYHALVINLLFDYFDGKPPFYTSQHQSSATIHAGALEIALSSAREISALIRLHREQYGIVHAHQYVMYTMALALFTIIEQKTFNVLDYDFISLTNSFAIFANLSQVGSDLFRIFRQSVKKRSRKEQAEKGEEEKFWDTTSLINSPDRWTDYAEALRKLAGTDDAEDSSSVSAASGIGDMLSMYETLSLGKEDNLKSRQPSDSFRFSPTP